MHAAWEVYCKAKINLNFGASEKLWPIGSASIPQMFHIPQYISFIHQFLDRMIDATNRILHSVQTNIPVSYRFAFRKPVFLDGIGFLAIKLKGWKEVCFVIIASNWWQDCDSSTENQVTDFVFSGSNFNYLWSGSALAKKN